MKYLHFGSENILENKSFEKKKNGIFLKYRLLSSIQA